MRPGAGAPQVAAPRTPTRRVWPRECGVVAAVVWALVAVTGGARAQVLTADAGVGTSETQTNIQGFKIDFIKPVDDAIELDADRFVTGSSTIDDEHVTNIADCAGYNLESSDGDPCRVVDTAPRVKVRWSADDVEDGMMWTAMVGSCASATTLLDAPSGCRLLTPSAATVGSTNEFEVSLAPLIGTLPPEEDEDAGAVRKCCAELLGTAGTVNLYVFVAESTSSDANLRYDSIVFRYDYKRPPPPADVQVESRGETIDVSWTKPANTSESEVTFRVYYDTHIFRSTAELVDVPYDEVAGQFDSTVLSNLDVDATYYVGVVTVDDADNPSQLDAVYEVPTFPTLDGFEYYKSVGGGEDGGFCFVATAVYGSYDHPHVRLLRRFRDEVLARSAAGQAFVRWYYAHGARWAAAIADSIVLRTLASALVGIGVGFAYLWLDHPVVLGVVLSLLGLAIVGMAWRSLRRLRASQRMASGACEEAHT